MFCMNAITKTNFKLSDSQEIYWGKVRDVYDLNDRLAIVASDRISAFDHILPKPIPFKGQILNQIAIHFLEATKEEVPNWFEYSPDPNVSIGKKAVPIKIEMVVRAYLAGHAWREYKSGKREICGVSMPEGMKEADRFPNPIITPATKAEEGHDEDISAEAILAQGIVSKSDWETLSIYALKLFDIGSKMANEQGLILVDTKYEFGYFDNQIILIDEVHTPDSSRYYIKEGYPERQEKGEKQKQLSKEFVREWLMQNGFQGKDGQVMPVMPDDFVDSVTKRYIELYELITGKTFQRRDTTSLLSTIESNIIKSL